MRNKKPYIEVKTPTRSCWEGWNKIAEALNAKIKSLHTRKIIITVECYQGTYEEINLRELKKRLPVNATCTSRDAFKNEEEIIRQCEEGLARVPFGAKTATYDIEEYFDPNKLHALRQNIEFIEEGVVLIFGVGASKICTPDILIYADMSRWEVMQRFKRNDVPNIGVSNSTAPFDVQYRWSYFIDWKICDKLKKQLLGQCDYFLETNNWEKPKLATGDVIRETINLAARQPFFTAPFYDPELWESNKQSKSKKDEEFSWVFNCVAEENNVLFKINDCLVEVPSINLIYAVPQMLLGERVYRNFGSELPIRLIFLDSLGGTQEKLHAYPGIDFLKDNFGFYYTQCEVFYVMDTEPGARLRLGFKNNMDAKQFQELTDKDHHIKKSAADKFLNTIKLHRHDHISIPVGTVHSSGNHAMILKVSSAPEIFSLNLPEDILTQETSGHKPVYDINEVKKLLSSAVSEAQIESTYYNQHRVETENDGWREEVLNQQNDQLQVSRVRFRGKLTQKTNGSIQVLNLIEGEEAVITSPEDRFDPFLVQFAESFVIPALVDEYTITPKVEKEREYVILKITV